MLVCICSLFLFCFAVSSITDYIWISYFHWSPWCSESQSHHWNLGRGQALRWSNLSVMQPIRIADKLLKCWIHLCKLYMRTSCHWFILWQPVKPSGTKHGFSKTSIIPFSNATPVSEGKCYFYRHYSLPWKEKEYQLLVWRIFTIYSYFISYFTKALTHWIFKVKTTDERVLPFTVL